MVTLKITPDVYEVLKNTVGTLTPETGAVIGAYDSSPDSITHVWWDNKAGSAEYYIPSMDIYTQIKKWRKNGAYFCGIVHSHDEGYSELSTADIRSAELIIHMNRMKYLYLGLFHRGELSMFKVLAEENFAPHIEKVEYHIIDVTC